ncbi:MAG TPA: DUF4062 domain-containing protein [Candidatus Angelobacter sp.]|jgi:hypothetical protein|nr:DUF4062 domain-containing protein [Candidatus Angelobacter sp.]
MAIPRVFVSSTCYDLKYIRENLRYFIKTLGYEPVLSEDGAIFYDPNLHTQDACLTEIPTCQLFVLIIGGRFGGRYRTGVDSITNHEYREAVRQKIPVFALVDAAVYNEHHLYLKNKLNSKVDLNSLVFPAVDSIRVFDFIDEVRGNTINNALVPFRDFGDMEVYLRQQWAGMMFNFLAAKNEERRVGDMLAALGAMNARIEILSKQILVSVGTEDAKIDASLYEEMLVSQSIRDLGYWGSRPTPRHILENKTFESCVEALGLRCEITDWEGNSIGPNTRLSRTRFQESSKDYEVVRNKLLQILEKHKISKEEYVKRHLISSVGLPAEISGLAVSSGA